MNGATPRTDAAAGTPSHDWEATAQRLFEESQKLERELTRDQKALAKLRDIRYGSAEVIRFMLTMADELLCDIHRAIRPGWLPAELEQRLKGRVERTGDIRAERALATTTTLTTTPTTPMPIQAPHIPLFSQLENTVTTEPAKNGLTFWWSRKGVGFGSLYLGVKNGKLVVDTECMSPEFCAEIIKQAITEALAREKGEEGQQP